MKGYDWDGLHEYEAQFFGFVPKGFTDVGKDITCVVGVDNLF